MANQFRQPFVYLGMGPKKEDRTLSKEVFHLAEKQTWLKPVQKCCVSLFWLLFLEFLMKTHGTRLQIGR